jgi:hypothetical protein
LEYSVVKVQWGIFDKKKLKLGGARSRGAEEMGVKGADNWRAMFFMSYI